MRRPSWLMSSTTPSATRNSASFDRLQAENGRPCSAGLDLAIFLISRRCGQGELRRPAALVPRVQRAEPVGVEVADHVADPVLAGERHLRDRGHVHALGGEQHHLRPPPGHHRPAAPAHDPHQPPALVIIDLTHPQPFGHRPSLEDQQLSRHSASPAGANVTCYGTRACFKRCEIAGCVPERRRVHRRDQRVAPPRLMRHAPGLFRKLPAVRPGLICRPGAGSPAGAARRGAGCLHDRDRLPVCGTGNRSRSWSGRGCGAALTPCRAGQGARAGRARGWGLLQERALVRW